MDKPTDYEVFQRFTDMPTNNKTILIMILFQLVEKDQLERLEQLLIQIK